MMFKTERINEHIVRIEAFLGEMMYLVTGKERACLIDTGSGFGSLKELIGGMTEKPVTVLLTHGHVDHAMGAGELDEVYLNSDDEYVYHEHADEAFRKKAFHQNPALKDMKYIPSLPFSAFRELKEGDVFDLGDLTIEAYALPGHTKGSMVFLLKEDRILISGDAANDATFLHEWYSIPLEEYENNLKRVNLLLSGTFDRVLTSHHSGEVGKNIFDGLIALIEEIREGRCDNIPFEMNGSEGYIAKEMEYPSMERKDGGCGNIIYNRDNLKNNAVHFLAMTDEYMKNRQMDKAKNCLLFAAQEGNRDAQALIGNGCITGQMGKKDYAEALFWSQQAGNHPMALTNMGKIYLEGLGVDKDYFKAKQYLNKAVEADYFKAYRYLGILCQKEGKSAEARQWLEKAADRNDITAAEMLGKICEEEGDYKKAVRYYSSAAESHSHIAKESMQRLIFIYENVLVNKENLLLAEELRKEMTELV